MVAVVALVIQQNMGQYRYWAGDMVDYRFPANSGHEGSQLSGDRKGRFCTISPIAAKWRSSHLQTSPAFINFEKAISRYWPPIGCLSHIYRNCQKADSERKGEELQWPSPMDSVYLNSLAVAITVLWWKRLNLKENWVSLIHPYYKQSLMGKFHNIC